MSFMLRIDAARRPPLDQLAVDYGPLRSQQPSIDFCRRTLGVPADDVTVAHRLGVTAATVRAWREIGRRASGRCT